MTVETSVKIEPAIHFEEKRRKAIQELRKGSTEEEQRKISKGLREGKKLRKIAEEL